MQNLPTNGTVSSSSPAPDRATSSTPQALDDGSPLLWNEFWLDFFGDPLDVDDVPSTDDELASDSSVNDSPNPSLVACGCTHGHVRRCMPPDAVLGAIVRGEARSRGTIEQLLGEPSASRCPWCAGPDVEYWFDGAAGASTVMLGLCYDEVGSILTLSLTTGAPSSGRCACFPVVHDDAGL